MGNKEFLKITPTKNKNSQNNKKVDDRVYKA
jgi:hypothetical protein